MVEWKNGMPDYTTQFKRLVSLGGTDEGFYVLALHSFVEGYANQLSPGITQTSKFHETVDFLIDWLKRSGSLNPEDRKALIRIAKEHDMTNLVRHEFARITPDEAAGFTHNFLGFCSAFGLTSPALADLKKALQLFDTKRPGLEVVQELEKARAEIAKIGQSNASMLQKMSEQSQLEEQILKLSATVDSVTKDLEAAQNLAENRDAKVEDLRKKLFDANQEKAQILKQQQDSAAAGEYLKYLERFANYTRTRLDYERTVQKLSDEQEAATAKIRETGDYLVKGGAGTGKTLVLLHALARQVESLNSSGNKQQILLLTYTNTLVKFSKYLSEIVHLTAGTVTMATADSHIAKAAKTLFPGAWVDFANTPTSQIKSYNTTDFLSDDELATEIEDVVWGNLITQEEYLEKHILRKGMRQPLNTPQRQQVWKIQVKLRADLIAQKKLSGNLACSMIVEAIQNGGPVATSLRVGRVYIDEAQDLSTATIRCLKALSTDGVVLAADDGQSIYKVGAQYQRAGLAIMGHSRILKTNFRNTRQIHEAAERFLSQGKVATGEERNSSSKREGPTPDLVTGKNEQELLKSLGEYMKLLTGKLGYDPENIGILAATNAQLEAIQTRLKSQGVASALVKDDKFDFASTGLVRLSTLHSSKGIEFPVVLVYVPKLTSQGDYDEKTLASIQRNLLYVAMTRAMDYVIVLTLESPQSEVLKELIEQLGSRA